MHRFLSLLVLLLIGSVAVADDWPQWLGPNRDATSTEKVLAWKNDPKLLWKQPVAEGFSSPVVADGRLFIHAHVKDKEEEELVALDAKTGKELWKKTYKRAAFQSMLGNGPRATPVVSVGRVYTYGITGVLSCYQAEDGKLLWQTDLYKKFKMAFPRFGVCSSPLVEGNRLLLSLCGRGHSIVALDTNNGDVVWQ